MKRSVIVCLIIALVMILLGLVLCVIGGKIAASDRIDLFARPDGEAAEITELGAAINRIIIDLKDADVIIRGGCTEQSITLTGFDGIFHEVSTTGGTVTVSGTPGWSTVLRLLTRGFSYDGLRFYTRAPAQRTERPTVILSLTGHSIRNYDITLQSGSLTVSDITYAADYQISIGQGELTMDRIAGISDLAVSMEEGSAMICIATAADSCTVTTGKGNLTFEIPEDETRSYSLVTVGGTVSFYGIDRGGTMNFSPETPAGSLSARTDNGDILICTPRAAEDTSSE